MATKQVFGKHTTENMTEALLAVIKQFNLEEKLVGLTTDNAKNCLGIGAKLMSILNSPASQGSKPKELWHLSCVAHILNLIVKKLNASFNIGENENDDLLSESNNEYFEDNDDDDELVRHIKLTTNEDGYLDTYKQVVAKCRNIATSVHQCHLLAECLENKQKEFGIKPKKVIQDVATRWNSTFLMLQRTYELIPVIYLL